MSKNTYLSAVALAALAAPAFAQSGTPVLPPAATTVYNGFSRGGRFVSVLQSTVVVILIEDTN